MTVGDRISNASGKVRPEVSGEEPTGIPIRPGFGDRVEMFTPFRFSARRPSTVDRRREKVSRGLLPAREETQRVPETASRTALNIRSRGPRVYLT